MNTSKKENFSLFTWITKYIIPKPDQFILNQKYKLLETKFEKIKYEQGFTSSSNIIILKLEELFSKTQSWTNLSQIELFLVSLYTEGEVAIEMKIKLLEAKQKLDPETVKFYEEEVKGKLSISDKKILLNNLNEKIQLVDDIQDLEKTYVALTRIRTSVLFFIAIGMFFAIDQVSFIIEIFSLTKGSKGDAIITSLSAGWLGTSFSMLMGLRDRLTSSSLTDLKVIHRIDYIFSRAIIGFTSGLLMYYLFQSQLISGPFFPSFTKEIPIFDDKNYALLVVWCFISGFSEKLVPDILNKTQEKITEKKPPESSVKKKS